MSRPTAAPAIVVEQLVREFKKGPRAVDGIDLEIAGGETYGFLGPNGAGALFGATMAGGDLARDIETGFLNRCR